MKAKILPLKKSVENEQIDLEACKQILNTSDKQYTDEEIIRIRDYLYQLAEIECRYFRQWQEEQFNDVIPINTNNHETKESISLYPGEYRRTG